ncbi:MAG: hypothetical protein JWO56_3129 [Acidobacteria bacterium]|nr:hypothetical protein [Acidobacteriota bacterium]
MILSPALQTYRPADLYRILLGTVGFVMAAALIAMGRDGSESMTFGGIAVAVLTIIGLYAMGGKLLTIHPEGVRVRNRFGQKEMEWQEVKEYRYRAVPAQGHAHAGLIGAIAIAAARRSMGPQATTSFYLTIVANDGRKLTIDPQFRDTYEAIGHIVNKLHERLRPQADTALPHGAIFGPLRLTLREVQYKSKEPIPLHELVRAELRGQVLDIKKQGKLLSSVAIRSDKVPNVLLLVEMMEKLGVGTIGGGTAGASAPNPQGRVRI